MASTKWVTPSQATIDYFERLAPGAPLETRKMFGLPSRFLHGYMLVGVFGDSIVLHLSEVDRAACIKAGARPFTPMGRNMKAYVAITPGTFEDHDLKWWIVRGMRHLATLPPRVVEAKPKKAPASERSAKPAKAKSTKKVAPKPAPKKAARTAAPKTKKPAAKRRPTPKKTRPAAKKARSRR
jgi:TfoX/Sxy family transcriptional regulator of competence genes